MIVVEEKLRALFDMIPEIQINTNNLVKPCFSWGDELALTQFMDAAYKDVDFNLYPLIWLLPSVDDHNPRAKTLKKDIRLVISTLETRNETLNDQRLQGSFKKVLNPLADYIEQCFLNSSITIVLSENIKTFKRPNYSVNKKSGAIDKWDAMTIDLEVEFNNNCIKPLRWRK